MEPNQAPCVLIAYGNYQFCIVVALSVLISKPDVLAGIAITDWLEILFTYKGKTQVKHLINRCGFGVK